MLVPATAIYAIVMQLQAPVVSRIKDEHIVSFWKPDVINVRCHIQHWQNNTEVAIGPNHVNAALRLHPVTAQ